MSCFFSVGRGHFGADAAADVKIPDHFHPARLAGGDQVVQNHVRHFFVKSPFVTVSPKIKFEGF